MRYHDKRCGVMWTRVLGAQKDLAKITPAEWRTFTRERLSGETDGHGEKVAPDERTPTRARTVAADLEWLKGRLDLGNPRAGPGGALSPV